jgi:hypothetical protein
MLKNRVALVFCSLTLAGCISPPAKTDNPDAAAGASAPVPAHTLRVVVKAPLAAMNPERMAREASRLSGMPVRYLSTMGNQWHSLALVCPDIVSCSTAFDRLEASVGTFDSVQRDSWRKPLSN